jgi:hypothetical protein
VDWTAAAIHVATAPLPWEQETDPNAGTVYPKAALQSRRPWRDAFPGWMPPSLAVFAVIVVLGIIGMGLVANLRGGNTPAAMAIASPQIDTPQSELTATPTLPMPTETPTPIITSTITPTPPPGRCEYTVKAGDTFWKFNHDWSIDNANISCEDGRYCPGGKLGGLYEGMVVFFSNVSQATCQKTIGGTPIPSP